MAPVDGYLLRLEHEGCKNQALLRVISSPHSRLDPFFFFLFPSLMCFFSLIVEFCVSGCFTERHGRLSRRMRLTDRVMFSEFRGEK